MTTTFEVRQLEGKGSGLVAVTDITRGSLILVDEPILAVNTTSPTNQDIETAFGQLNEECKTTYLSLYEGRSNFPLESKVEKIFLSNHFGDEHSKWVFPMISRINHSCVPNATIVDSSVFAQKSIQAGEEIQICYKESWDEVLTASQRNLLFKHRYGFTCRCNACVPEVGGSISDGRRLLIRALRFALEGKMPADFNTIMGFRDDDKNRAVMRDAHWPPKVPSMQSVKSASQRIEYTLLLARLREAEGLGSLRTGRAYIDAVANLATLLTKYDSMSLLPGRRVLFVEAARCCVAWMKKAVEHAGYGEGSDSETVRLYEAALQNLRTGSGSLPAVTLSLAGEDKSRGVQEEKCYAVSMDLAMKERPRSLTLKQVKELLKGRA